MSAAITMPAARCACGNLLAGLHSECRACFERRARRLRDERVESRQTGYRLISSKFEGSCRHCGCRFGIANAIAWRRGGPFYHWSCARSLGVA
jgi:hypothetical protein